jgi:signal transduction histidine kinase
LIDLPDGRRLRVQAERFVLPSGHNFVAVATADRIELEKKYAALIALFAVAAFVSLLLVAGGGWFLARKATGPVERGVEHMRRFMAEAAHELRTPITILRSRADVALQRDRGAEAYVEALTQVRREAEQLSGIVDDLLTLARAEAGELALRLERVHLDEVALDAVAAAGALAERRQVQLNVGAAEEAEVHADAGLLRQLTMILLDNALKFTPAGGRVTLDVGAVNGEASLQVRDTGVGITPAELPRIFDRFYRGGEARRHASGAGLGLSIARWIVQAHGGRIVADSQPGSGTTISVTLPTIRSAAAH